VSVKRTPLNTPDSGLTDTCSTLVRATYTVVRLVTHDCTSNERLLYVIDRKVYRQYECQRGIRCHSVS